MLVAIFWNSSSSKQVLHSEIILVWFLTKRRTYFDYNVGLLIPVPVFQAKTSLNLTKNILHREKYSVNTDL